MPEGKQDEFVAHGKRLIANAIDLNGQDFTSIIDERAFARLQSTLEDARAKGATIVNLAEGQMPSANMRKFAPHVVLNPTEDMIVMQRGFSARSCR